MPPSEAHSDQLLPAHQRCHSAVSVPRTNTSPPLTGLITDKGSPPTGPPNRSPLAQLPPAVTCQVCQGEPSAARINTSRRPSSQRITVGLPLIFVLIHDQIGFQGPAATPICCRCASVLSAPRANTS